MIAEKLNSIINVLEKAVNPSTIKSIADELDISKSTIAIALNSLEKDGYVCVVTNPNKQRRGQVFKYTLTAKGHSVTFSDEPVTVGKMSKFPTCDAMRFLNMTTNRTGKCY